MGLSDLDKKTLDEINQFSFRFDKLFQEVELLRKQRNEITEQLRMKEKESIFIRQRLMSLYRQANNRLGTFTNKRED